MSSFRLQKVCGQTLLFLVIFQIEKLKIKKYIFKKIYHLTNLISSKRFKKIGKLGLYCK